MSFWKKLSKVAKDVGKKAIEEGKKKAEELKLQSQKRELLRTLKKNDLLNLAMDFEVPVTQMMRKEEIISRLAKNKSLTIKAIMTFSKQVKRKSRRKRKFVAEEMEIEQEIVRTERIKTRVRKVSSIEKKLLKELKEFKPLVRGRFREKNLENQLLIWLQRPFEKVDYQVPSRRGKVDIVVDGKYAIELKLVSSPSQLHTFLGQIFAYSREYEKVFLVIYDSRGSIKPANIRELEEFFKEMNVTNVEIIKKP